MPYSKAFEYLHGVHKQVNRHQLTEILFINALRELRLAKTFLQEKAYYDVHLHCINVHNILIELNRSLDKRYSNEFCLEQEALYQFCFECLRQAWHQGNEQGFNDLEEILMGLLENWRSCMSLIH
jgi:flagellar biosynthetic protein FliS